MSTQWRLTTAAAVATVLTALSLSPTVDSGGWLLPLLVVVTVVAATAGGARQLTLPRWVVTGAALVALLLSVTATFARPQAVLWVLPGRDVWARLTDLAGDGLTTVWQVAPPVPDTRGVGLVIVTGVGLVAVLVDAMAVTWRHPAAAGIPLLVLYLVPAAVLPQGVPWPLFVVASLGWLGLLLSDGRARLRSWGRIVSAHDDSSSASSIAVAATGRRLGAAALAVAVVAPVALPMLSNGLLGFGGGGEGEGPGGGPQTPTRRIVTINPLVNLKRDLVRGSDVAVLTYRTDDTSPDYLRLATLDIFDGQSWQLQNLSASAQQQVSDGLPTAPGLTDQVSRTPVTTEVAVVGLDSQRLPLPYPVTQVAIDGDWRFDAASRDVFTPERSATTLGMTYTVSSLALAPTADQLRAADPAVADELRPFLLVPPFTASELLPVTTRVVGDATTGYDQALAIQNWFRRTFTYSLERRSGNGLTDLQAFLADRSGYCEQFAATMALMARVAGIPSRVVVGFAPGTRRADGVWEVTAHDAHAWPELWFNGIGWVRFEPTPGGGDGTGTPVWAPVPVRPGQSPSNGPTDGASGSPTTRPNAGRLPDEPGGAGSAVPAPGPARWPLVLAALLLAAAVLASPAAVAAVGRRRRWRAVADVDDATEAAWQDVLDVVGDLSERPAATETTRDVAARLARLGGMSARGRQALARLSHQVELARYASGADLSLRVDDVRADAAAVRQDLRAALPSSRRWQARLWPASGRARIGLAVGALGVRTDRVLAALSRWSRQVSGRVRRADGPTAARSDA